MGDGGGGVRGEGVESSGAVCESRGCRPGFPVSTVSVDVKLH